MFHLSRRGADMTGQDCKEFVIDPRKYRKESLSVVFFITFLLFWIPFVAYCTYIAFINPDPFIKLWLVGGYVGAIFGSLHLMSMNRKQILVVEGELLIISGSGIRSKSQIQVLNENIEMITLEHYGGKDNEETIYTLNLLQKRGVRPRRIALAYFVHPTDKAVLFDQLVKFLRNAGFVFEIRNEMTLVRNHDLQYFLDN
jgi:hypothetical protein